MIAATEFAPVSEVAFRASQLPGYDRNILHAQLVQLPIFRTDYDVTFRRIDVRVLARHDEKYAFVNENSWCVRVLNAHESSEKDISISEAMRGDHGLFPGGLTAIDAEYDERLREVLSPPREPKLEKRLSELATFERADEMLKAIDIETLMALDAADGSFLYLRQKDAAKLLCSLQDAPVELPVLRPKSRAETAVLWQEYVAGFKYPNKPNAAERKRWGRDRGLNSDRVVELNKELSPEYWRRAGKVPKVLRVP